MKTTNTITTKPNETKAWFRSLFMQSGEEMDQLAGPITNTSNCLTTEQNLVGLELRRQARAYD